MWYFRPRPTLESGKTERVEVGTSSPWVEERPFGPPGAAGRSAPPPRAGCLEVVVVDVAVIDLLAVLSAG